MGDRTVLYCVLLICIFFFSSLVYDRRMSGTDNYELIITVLGMIFYIGYVKNLVSKDKLTRTGKYDIMQVNTCIRRIVWLTEQKLKLLIQQ
mgnify:CR=1 FL=1